MLLSIYIPKALPITSHSLTLSLPALNLTVADKATKEVLGTFQLPVRHLQPFQPHCCRLVLVGTVPAPPSRCLFLLRTCCFHPRAVAGVVGKGNLV